MSERVRRLVSVDRCVDAIMVGRAWLAGGAHSDASWSIREHNGVVLRHETFDGVDDVAEVDEATVRRTVETYGPAAVRWSPAPEVVGWDLPPDDEWTVIADETWTWSLARARTGRLALVVVCGSVGIYERVVMFDDAMAAAWARHGRRLLDVLAEEVRSTP